MQLFSHKKTAALVALSLLAGFAGGFAMVWALLIQNLFGFAYSYPLRNAVIDNRPITIIEPGQITLEYDVAVEQVLNDTAKSSALLFARRETTKATPENSYVASEAIGRAIAVTSDGWFITSEPVVQASIVVYAPSFNARTVYPIETVIKDPHSDSYYFKITTSEELSITRFAKKETLHKGESVVVMNALGEGALGAIVALEPPRDRETLIRLSEAPVTYPIISIPEGMSRKGLSVFTTEGSLIAMADVVSGELFMTDWELVLPQVLRKETIERPFIGLQYVLLSDFISNPGSDASEMRNGAWIRGTSIKPAIRKDSPAAKAGLADGDVILAIERDTVTEGRDLYTLLSQYAIGETIDLRVVKPDGSEKTLELTIGSY